MSRRSESASRLALSYQQHDPRYREKLVAEALELIETIEDPDAKERLKVIVQKIEAGHQSGWYPVASQSDGGPKRSEKVR